MIEVAVFELYTDARSVEHHDDGTITVRDADSNIITIDDNAVQARTAELQNEYEQEVINKENKRASAKQKLQDLGLTAEEIKETFGL